jgi:hypothetical protein
MKDDIVSILGAIFLIVIVVALFGAAGYGWVMNLVAIAKANFSQVDGMIILRVVGIFIAPIGVVLGYL